MRIPLSRRSVLRGLGAAVALPFLDAMAGTGSLASAATTAAKALGGAASAAAPTRLAWFFIPNGVNMPNWQPKATGADFELPPSLVPLKSVKNYMTVFSGLTLDSGRAHG